MRAKNIIVLHVMIVTILSTVLIGCVENVRPYDTDPQQLSLGDTVSIEGVEFTVEDYELMDEYIGNHDLNTFYNVTDNKFLYLLVHARNTDSNSLEIPSQYDVKIMLQDRPYRPEVNFISEEKEPYEFNWLEEGLIESGHSKEGWILYQVPEILDIADIRVIVEFPHVSYTKTAIWSLNPE